MLILLNELSWPLVSWCYPSGAGAVFLCYYFKHKYNKNDENNMAIFSFYWGNKYNEYA